MPVTAIIHCFKQHYYAGSCNNTLFEQHYYAGNCNNTLFQQHYYALNDNKTKKKKNPNGPNELPYDADSCFITGSG